jgi:hypothetical protein
MPRTRLPNVEPRQLFTRTFRKQGMENIPEQVSDTRSRHRPDLGSETRPAVQAWSNTWFANGTQDSTTDKADTGTIAVNLRKKMKLEEAVGGKKAWAGILEAKILKSDLQSQVHQATITQLVPSTTGKARERFEPIIWNLTLRCLKCHSSLN